MRGALSGVDIAALKAGNEDVFRAIVKEYQHRILAFCLRMVADPSLAQDIAQEVFLTLWRERRRYQEEDKLVFYLLKIARFRCLAEFKKNKARKRILMRAKAIERLSPKPDSGEGVDHDLQNALQRLSKEHRDIVVLRHLEGLNLQEIQQLCELPMGTIKSRLHRGLAELRGFLDG